MTMIRKLISAWMLALVGSLLLPLVSVAAVSGTTHVPPTTAPVTVTQHTVTLRVVPHTETGLQASGQLQLLCDQSHFLNATKRGPITDPKRLLPEPKTRGRMPGQTVDPITGQPVGRIVVDPKGNAMIEPVGGKTVPAGPTLKGGVRPDTHTTYPDGSTYQRLNPAGHSNNPVPHAHGHAPGTGPGMKGQGPALDTKGNVVPKNSPDAHWPAN